MSAQTKVGAHRPDTKRAQAKAATQAKVLAAAREAFHHSGYDAVKMRDLAKSAGMSTGAIFSSWPSKSALFAAATGEPEPDVKGFLRAVYNAAVETTTDAERFEALRQLALESVRLRRCLYGSA